MKILFLSDNFYPETNAPANRTYDHCLEWVRKGIDVTVITCVPNFPEGKVHNGYSNKLIQKERINGIKVIRVWSYISKNSGFYKRILDFISYSIMAFFIGIFQKFDIVIGTSPQFFTVVSARFLSFFKMKPWVMEVRDIWPESIVAVGLLNKNSFSYKFIRKIEIWLYKSANRIIVVTDSFRNYLISLNINPEKIEVVKNGINLEEINNFKNSVNKEIDLNIPKNKLIICYAGTLGMAHGLDFIINSLTKLKNKNFHFLFIGDGAEKNNLIELSKKLELDNITFLKRQKKSDLYKIINNIDVSLVNLKKNNTFLNVIPSKIFENIAFGKPILLGLEGESKQLINSYRVGITFEPESQKSFINALKKIENFCGTKVENNFVKMSIDFDRKKLAAKMLKFLLKKV